MTFFESEKDKSKVLVTCDAGGNLIASDISYSNKSGRIEKVVPFLKRELMMVGSPKWSDTKILIL